METKTRTKLRTALFSDKTSAESAYTAAISHGYKPSEITVIMSDDTKKRFFGTDTIKVETGDKSMEGLAIGGALGGTLLGTLGAIVALSTTIVIPGVGLVIAGPLAAALTGVGAGSVAGGILGALIGAGIPEERAQVYEKGLKEGGIVVGVTTTDEETDDGLLEDWKKSKGTSIL